MGAAWGTELFDGRGHFETAARYRKQAQIPISARPYGMDGQQWVMTGNGSVATPFVETPYARFNNAGMVGAIGTNLSATQGCGTACTVNNSTFASSGVLRPFIHGTPTTSGTIESGGDGASTFRTAPSVRAFR